MKRFLFSLVGLFFAYLCFINVMASLQPPDVGRVYSKIKSFTAQSRDYYTGKAEHVDWPNEDIIPRCTSLIVHDDRVYLRVNLPKFFSAMGYSKYPEDWKSSIRELLSSNSRFTLDHQFIGKHGERVRYYFSWLFLDEPISDMEDVGSFKIYDPQSDRFYILLVD
ncbi:MAG: hypothetical protein IJR14_03080 [Synergistaceae bacterium]|nr:hypothetical protein [Synergistaceae bacterium]